MQTHWANHSAWIIILHIPLNEVRRFVLICIYTKNTIMWLSVWRLDVLYLRLTVITALSGQWIKDSGMWWLSGSLMSVIFLSFFSFCLIQPQYLASLWPNEEEQMKCVIVFDRKSVSIRGPLYTLWWRSLESECLESISEMECWAKAARSWNVEGWMKEFVWWW